MKLSKDVLKTVLVADMEVKLAEVVLVYVVAVDM